MQEPISFPARIKRSVRYRTNRYLGLIQDGIKSNAQLVGRELESQRDKTRLRLRFPQLARYAELAVVDHQKLRPYYEDYVSRISVADWAISLELSTFLLVMCELLKPERILDLGSGFSSFVFRYYMANTATKPVVCSVDNNEAWLEKTRSFLENHDLSSEGVTSWRYFSERNDEKFDFILHDMGDSWDFRKETLKPIIALSKSAGTVILDDIHLEIYRPYAMTALKDLKLTHYSLRSFTLDKIGRYSQMICR